MYSEGKLRASTVSALMGGIQPLTYEVDQIDCEEQDGDRSVQQDTGMRAIVRNVVNGLGAPCVKVCCEIQSKSHFRDEAGGQRQGMTLQEQIERRSRFHVFGQQREQYDTES